MEEKEPKKGYSGRVGDPEPPEIRLPSDRELMAWIQQGDEQATTTLYIRYHRRVLNYLYRFTGNRTLAEEAAQETFVRVIRHAKSYRPTGSVAGWIFRIGKNLTLNMLRRKRLFSDISLDEPIQTETGALDRKEQICSGQPGPREAAERGEQDAAIQAALVRVAPIYREAVILCDIEGHPYKEAAEILNCSINTVASRLARGRAQLAKRLGYLKER